jgi:hypothetical protein
MTDAEDSFRLAEWQALPNYCFIGGCGNDEIDERGPIWVRDGEAMHKACTEHWEAIMRILGEQATWERTDAMRCGVAGEMEQKAMETMVWTGANFREIEKWTSRDGRSQFRWNSLDGARVYDSEEARWVDCPVGSAVAMATEGALRVITEGAAE